MQDPALRNNFLLCFQNYIEKLNEFEDQTTASHLEYVRIMYLTHDLKYMAKDSTLPLILNSDFLDRLLGVFQHFYFSDVVTQSKSMDAYENSGFKAITLQSEKTMVDRCKKFILFANHNQDIQKRVLNTFR